MTERTAVMNMTHYSYRSIDIQDPTYLPLVIWCFKEKCIYYRYGICLDFLVRPVWKIINTTEECEYTQAVDTDLPIALLKVKVEGLFALNVNHVKSGS